MLRRKFLKLTGLGAGAVVAVPILGFATTTYEEAIAGFIKKEVGYLNLDKKGLNDFIADFSKYTSDKDRLKVKGLYLMGVKPTQSDTVRGIITAYLFSTDFFINKMDESKPVKYVGLKSPYTSPCSHPFSHIYYAANII